MLDIDKLTDAMVAHTVKAIATATEPLLSRIQVLEGQVKAVEGKPYGLKPEDVSALVEAAEGRVKAHADEAIAKAVTALPELPEMPEAPELPDIPALIAEAVEEAVKSIPVPQDGADGQDGESVTIDDVLPAFHDHVKEFFDAIPMPSDGVDGKDGLDGKDGDRGEPGRDGLDVKDLFRADGGKLVAVMSDGTTKDLGVFVGADGKDGEPGKDGSDGLGFEDMDFETDEHGRVSVKFQRGEIVKSVRIPGIVDRGPYRSGDDYIKGDAVSYGGSLWIAQDDTSDKPDGGKGWRLAVKKGRDAKTVSGGKNAD